MNIGAYRGCLAIGLAPCNSFNSFKFLKICTHYTQTRLLRQ